MSDNTEESATQGDEQLAQQELLESCLDLVFSIFDEALADKIVNPVVFLLDCEDEIGQEIAGGWLGADNVRDAIAERQLEEASAEATTLYARAVSWADCKQEVPIVFPYLAPAFESKMPTDGFLAIVVTAGGAALFTVPESAREA